LEAAAVRDGGATLRRCDFHGGRIHRAATVQEQHHRTRRDSGAARDHQTHANRALQLRAALEVRDIRKLVGLTVARAALVDPAIVVFHLVRAEHLKQDADTRDSETTTEHGPWNPLRPAMLDARSVLERVELHVDVAWGATGDHQLDRLGQHALLRADDLMLTGEHAARLLRRANTERLAVERQRDAALVAADRDVTDL